MNVCRAQSREQLSQHKPGVLLFLQTVLQEDLVELLDLPEDASLLLNEGFDARLLHIVTLVGSSRSVVLCKFLLKLNWWNLLFLACGDLIK